MTSSSFNVLDGFKVSPIVFLLRALLLLHLEFVLCGNSLHSCFPLKSLYIVFLFFASSLCSLVTFVFYDSVVALCIAFSFLLESFTYLWFVST